MKAELLKQILERYRTSGDFNGLYFEGESPELKAVALELVREGLVQVVSEDDYINPHIRPWPSRRTVEQQAGSIDQLDGERYGVCLYPTPEALKKHRTRRTYPDEPYRQSMANGRGTLELAYFKFEVLEQYRNDPRFSFHFDDFGGRTVVADDVYLDDDEPEHDKIIMDHIGFAYDLSRYDRDDPDSPIIRRVCAFYGDLAKLTPTHQQRWRTYEVSDEGLSPHPVWWGTQMGHWPNGPGPFERFFYELESLNALHERAFGEQLFGSVERPREFGWILRPSQAEWDAFIHQLDKLLSENLRDSALDALDVPRNDDKGQRIGTLNRLSMALERREISEDDVQHLMKPLKDVRRARQRPAHALRQNVTDESFVHRQIELLEQVNHSLQGLREFWQRHPANRDWEEPSYMQDAKRQYRM